MKKHLVGAIIPLLALLLIGVAPVFAIDTIYDAMPTQGFLAGPGGAPVPDGQYTIIFSIHNDSLGGALLWEETQTVTTTGGMFSVRLGTVNAIPDSAVAQQTSDTTGKRFLQITVNGENLLPRTPMGSTPFARFSRGINGHVVTRPSALSVPDTAGNERIQLSAAADIPSLVMFNWFDQPAVEFKADTSGGQVTLYFREIDSFREGIEMKADATGGHLEMRDTNSFRGILDAHGMSFLNNDQLALAVDATAVGGVITIGNPSVPGDSVALGPPDTVFRGFKNGQMTISARNTAAGGSIMIGNPSVPGDSVTLGPPDTVFRGFKNGQSAIAAMVTATGGNLEVQNVSDATKVVVDGHGIELFTGAKANLVAGLSSAGLTLTTGASDGYVLTSDASGLGTWQPPTGGGSCWNCADSLVWLADTTDRVAIGTTYATAKLDVDVSGGVGRRAAEFRNNYASTGGAGVGAATVTVQNTSNYGIAINAYTTSLDATMVLGNDNTSGQLIKCFGYGGAVKFRVDANGKVGINNDAPTAALDVVGATGYNQVRMRTSYTPTGTADANGSIGDIAWDNNYMYVKTTAGWKRAALSTW